MIFLNGVSHVGKEEISHSRKGSFIPIEKSLRKFKLGEDTLWINPNTQDIILDDGKDYEVRKDSVLHKVTDEEFQTYASKSHDVLKVIPVRNDMPRAHYLCIQPTGDCNLRCKYCFTQLYDNKNSKVIDFNTAKMGIDYMFSKSEDLKDRSIGFFGGEPTLCKSIVEKIVYYTLGKFGNQGQVKFHMTTNATMIDDWWMNFFRDTGYWTFIVSIDGPKEIHDRSRKDWEGNGTYDRVMEGLIKLKTVSKSITLRSTYSSDDLHIKERIQHLNELCWMGLGDWVSVEPVQMSEDQCMKVTDGKMHDFGVKELKDVYSQLKDTVDWYLDCLSECEITEVDGVKKLTGKKVPIFHHIDRIQCRFLRKEFAVSECGAGYGYFTMDWNGDLYSCHRLTGTHIGSVKYGINEIERAKWLDNRLYNSDKCMNCMWRYFCGGVCRQSSAFEMKDIRKPNPVSCALKSEIYKANLYLMVSALRRGLYDKLEAKIADRDKKPSDCKSVVVRTVKNANMSS